MCMHPNVSFNTFSSAATVTILASEKKIFSNQFGNLVLPQTTLDELHQAILYSIYFSC